MIQLLTGLSSIFSIPVLSGQWQRRYGTAVWTRLRKGFMKTDMDERKCNAGNQVWARKLVCN